MNILTAQEAASVLRCEETDEDMVNLLPLIDGFIKNATGRDWSADTTIDVTAKSAARMLLVLWHENPGMIGAESSLSFGLRSVLAQLEVKAIQLAETT